MNNVINLQEWKEKKAKEEAVNPLFVAGDDCFIMAWDNSPFPQWCEILESEEAELNEN